MQKGITFNLLAPTIMALMCLKIFCAFALTAMLS